MKEITFRFKEVQNGWEVSTFPADGSLTWVFKSTQEVARFVRDALEPAAVLEEL